MPEVRFELPGSVRELIGDEVGINAGPSLLDLRERILRADGSLGGREPERARRSAPPGRPVEPNTYMLSTLPSALADFVGRAAELSSVTSALTDPAGGAPVVAISGMPGIGKTALAVRAALAVAGAFPDGQLFATLGNARDAAASGTSRVLAGFLQALGVTDLPATVLQQAAALRAALAGRRMVLVLDDVRSAAQVWLLMSPPPGCAAIVTSRHRLRDLPVTRRFEIASLTHDDSVDLLRRLVGAGRVLAEPAAAERLVEACCHHPAAIRAAGARLATRPAWQISALERHVRVESAAIHADGERHFESAYTRLSPEAAAAFRQASLTEGLAVSVTATSAALSRPEGATRKLLETLAETHLLEAGPGPAEFRYNPLVKAYAQRKAFLADRHARARSGASCRQGVANRTAGAPCGG